MKTVISGKPIVLVLALVLSLLISARPAKSYMYGEEQISRQLVVDKQLKTIDLNDWQDNLPPSQQALKEGDLIEFMIKVKNSGDQELNNIDVVDYLPSYLTLVFAPAMTNDQNEVVWQIEKLDPGQEENFRIRARAENSDQAIGEGSLCLMNRVRAEAETGEADEDTASFCIVRAKNLPQAGSHNLVIGTLVASIIAGVGIFLRKFGRGEILA